MRSYLIGYRRGWSRLNPKCAYRSSPIRACTCPSARSVMHTALQRHTDPHRGKNAWLAETIKSTPLTSTHTPSA